MKNIVASGSRVGYTIFSGGGLLLLLRSASLTQPAVTAQIAPALPMLILDVGNNRSAPIWERKEAGVNRRFFCLLGLVLVIQADEAVIRRDDEFPLSFLKTNVSPVFHQSAPCWRTETGAIREVKWTS